MVSGTETMEMHTGTRAWESSTKHPNVIATDVNLLELHPELSYPYLASLGLQILMGNIGNILVIGSVAVDRRLRKESNILILNLAFADLCVTGFVDPFSFLGVVLGPQYFIQKPALCHVIGSVCLVSCVCSLWTIAAISVNRYILLCKRSLYPRVFTIAKTIYISLILWAMAFMLDLPNYLDWGDHTYDMKTMACSYDRLASHSYTVFFITMFVTVPLITVCACNMNIFIVFLRSRRRVRASGATADVSVIDEISKTNHASRTVGTVMVNSLQAESCGSSYLTRGQPDTVVHDVKNIRSPQETTKSRGARQTENQASFDKKDKKPIKRLNLSKEFRLAKTLFVIFTVFSICWSPYALLCLIDKDDRVSRTAFVIAVQFAHSSSCINSILYAAMNKSFRDGYKMFFKTIFRCFKKQL